MSDFPPQARPTTADFPTHDVEIFSSDHSTLDAQKILKNNNMYQSTKGMIWVFTWSDIVGYFLQTVGLIAGVVFGIWAMRTYDAAKSSLAIATGANEISTEALTQSRHAHPPILLTPCSTVNTYLLMTVIKGMSPPDADATMRAPSPSKARTERFAIIVGTIVAVVTLFVAVGAFLVGKKRLRISVKLTSIHGQ